MMNTIKALMVGAGLGAAAMIALRKNPKAKQVMDDAVQAMTDKAEDLKDTLGM